MLQWSSIVFPSNAGITVNSGPATNGTATQLSFGISLSPRPGTVTSGDVTVPANGSENILFNFTNTHTNVDDITTSAFNSICISYQTPTQGLGVGGFTFHCKIVPNSSVNNPGSCN